MDNKLVKVVATVAFPSLTRPDQMSGKYSVQLTNLSPAAVEKLEELGIQPKFKDDDYNRGQFIEPKSAYPIDNSKYPTVFDDNKGLLDADLIGPGSKVKATIKAYDWEFRGKSGVGARLVKLEVVELAEPSAAVSADDDLEAL